MAELKVLFFYIDGGVKQAVYLTEKDLERWRKCCEVKMNFISDDGRVGLNPNKVSYWHVGDGHTEFFTKPFPATDEAAQAYASVGIASSEIEIKTEDVNLERPTEAKTTQTEKTFSKEDKSNSSKSYTKNISTSSYLIGENNKELLPVATPKYVNGIRNDFPEEIEADGDILHHVECKCGAEYYFRRDWPEKRSGCKNCGSIILLDYSKGTHLSELGLAYTVTNRYFVDQKKWQNKGRY